MSWFGLTGTLTSKTSNRKYSLQLPVFFCQPITNQTDIKSTYFFFIDFLTRSFVPYFKNSFFFRVNKYLFHYEVVPILYRPCVESYLLVSLNFMKNYNRKTSSLIQKRKKNKQILQRKRAMMTISTTNRLRRRQCFFILQKKLLEHIDGVWVLDSLHSLWTKEPSILSQRMVQVKIKSVRESLQDWRIKNSKFQNQFQNPSNFHVRWKN